MGDFFGFASGFFTGAFLGGDISLLSSKIGEITTFFLGDFFGFASGFFIGAFLGAPPFLSSSSSLSLIFSIILKCFLISFG